MKSPLALPSWESVRETGHPGKMSWFSDVGIIHLKSGISFFPVIRPDFIYFFPCTKELTHVILPNHAKSPVMCGYYWYPQFEAGNWGTGEWHTTHKAMDLESGRASVWRLFGAGSLTHSQCSTRYKGPWVHRPQGHAAGSDASQMSRPTSMWWFWFYMIIFYFVMFYY